MNDCLTLLAAVAIGAWVAHLCARVPGALNGLLNPLLSAIGAH